MSDVTTKIVSTVGWVEMAATKLDDAAKFYSEIFEWSGELMNQDSPMPYSIMKAGNATVAGIYELTGEMKERGIPPHWLMYIIVEDVDETVKLIEKNKGKILQPAFDVDGVGRMAVVQDPAEAVFAIWSAAETSSGIGKGKYASCWYELSTTDTEVCERFYNNVFGWSAKTDTSTGMDYIVFSTGEQMIGGMYKIPETMKGIPPNWVVYFEVPEFDATKDLALSKGAQLMGSVMEHENIGKFAYIQDPQGAVFAIIQSSGN